MITNNNAMLMTNYRLHFIDLNYSQSMFCVPVQLRNHQHGLLCLALVLLSFIHSDPEIMTKLKGFFFRQKKLEFNFI